MNLPIIIGIISGLSGAVAVYLVTLRKLSGTVKHSEAEDLWTESRSIREDLQKRNEFLRDRLDRCEARITELHERIEELEREKKVLEIENGRLRSL